MKFRRLLVAVCMTSCFSTVGWAAVAGVPVTFEDAAGMPTSAGWTFGNDGSVESDAGDEGTGDHALRYQNSGGMFTNTNLSSNFLGDYTAASIVGVEFKARHSGMGDSLVLRATMFSPVPGSLSDWAYGGTDAVSLQSTDTTWQTYTLPLTADDLIVGGRNGATLTIDEVLQNVSRFGLRHDPNATGPTISVPVTQPTAFYVDDIQLLSAVPEPAGFALLANVLLVGVAAIRRRRS